jgi:hypothetical protein
MNLKKGISGITLIVSAVIGLIIIVVVVMMITGKLGAFGKGVDEAFTCENTCNALGHDFSGTGLTTLNSRDCKNLLKGKIVPGKFSDIPDTNSDGDPVICCCFDNVD